MARRLSRVVLHGQPGAYSEYFVNFAALLEEEGADQIAIKDMAGILHPTTAAQLIPAIKERVSAPLSLHSHSTAGVALLNAVIAMRAGIDSIDTAVTPFAGGSSLPPVEVLVVFRRAGLVHNRSQAILRAHEECSSSPRLRSTSPFFGNFTAGAL